MGIIAGIKNNQDHGATLEVLTAMLKLQRHRDPAGTQVFHVNRGIAVGGVNHFNKDNRKDEHQDPGEGIYAFVDGIVLENNDAGFFPMLISAYRKAGLDFMNHLEGQFACALWDEAEKRLILARDPFGHKPLHYYAKNNTLYFSSEIKGLLAAGIPAELDLTSLSDFLTLNCIPYPATIFKDIYQVPPGGMLIADHAGVTIKTWWEPEILEDQSISLEDAVSGLSSVFRRSVEKCMLRDETYCFLSGGIDSSAIVSFASEIGGKKVHTISVGFEEEEENELHDAEIMARHVGANHHPLIVKPDSFFDMLDTLVFHHDSPFTDTSAYPTYFAAQAGAQFADIILTGDGPDQTMAGSGHYVFAVENDIFAERSSFKRTTARLGAGFVDKLVSAPIPDLLSKMQRKLYRDSLSPVRAAYDLRSYFPDIVKKFLCTDQLWQVHVANNPYRHPEKWFNEAGRIDDINKYLYADMKFYLPDDLMIKVDRMCMAHGLETLSPFLDKELVAITNRLPGSFKINREHGKTLTKHILKEICQTRFPSAILNKKKQGFGIPLEKWLRKDNGKAVKEILLDPRTLNRPCFKKKALENLVQVFLDGRGDYFYPSPNAVAGLLTIELWHRRYLD